MSFSGQTSPRVLDCKLCDAVFAMTMAGTGEYRDHLATVHRATSALPGCDSLLQGAELAEFRAECDRRVWWGDLGLEEMAEYERARVELLRRSEMRAVASALLRRSRKLNHGKDG